MFGLAPIIAGLFGSLFANGIAEKGKRQTNCARNNYAKDPEKYRFAFSEKTVYEKIEKIAKHFKLKLKINFKSYRKHEYGFRLIGKNSFYISIVPHYISISPWYEDYYFMLYDDSMSNFKACNIVDKDDDNIGFSSDISFNDLSDDEIFDIIGKIIEALYGATFMTYETAESEDGKESFTFYLDAPDYYGYTETTEIGNFKFILNKDNGGDKNV